jgi:hypothetical protein
MEWTAGRMVKSGSKPEKFARLAGGASELHQRPGRPLAHFAVEGVGGCEKAVQLGQSIPNARACDLAVIQFGKTFAEHGESGVEFAALSLLRDGAKHFPNIANAFEMIPPVAGDMDHSDDAPSLKLTEGCAHIGSGNSEDGLDFLGVEGAGAHEKERVDLGDGAIDTPPGAHLPPMKDELPLRFR